MKKFKFFVVLALVLLLLNPMSYALLCKNGQGVDQSDECWTMVRNVDTTYVVSVGSIMVHDFTLADTAEKAAIYARVATASADNTRIFGVAQSVIATNDTGMVLVRGKGKICVRGTVSTITTGDRLYVSSSAGKAGITYGNYSPDTISSADPIAFALETKTTPTAGTTMDAYIVALM